VVQLRTWPIHMPSTVRQPLARPESAVGWCWSAAWRPEASRIHKIDALYGGSPISGADSLAICSQNRFWYPKLPPPASSARMGVRNVFCTRAPENRLLRPYPTPKNPETPKNAIKSFGAQWILDASGHRAALQHRPTADLGRANGWRTVGGMWMGQVRSCTTSTLALGPRLRCVLAEGVLFTPKIRCPI
jgi:hypothetical protein